MLWQEPVSASVGNEDTEFEPASSLVGYLSFLIFPTPTVFRTHALLLTVSFQGDL